ncbi:MAG: hypothetical protein KGL39_28725 [Patescibacteria group bacterium]|nr:hypothetical protein [Patescibacteria group bacterium]
MQNYLRAPGWDIGLITELIRSSREYVERFTDKQLMQATYSLSVDYFPIYVVNGAYSLTAYQTLPNNMQMGNPMNQDVDWGILAPADYRRQHLPNFGNFVLPKPPLQSVVSVQYLDQTGTLQTMPSSDYQVITNNYPGYIKPVSGWPSTQQNTANAVTIVFTAGWPTQEAVPGIYLQAIRLLCAWHYENRLPVSGSDRAISESIDRLLAQEKQYSVV